MVHCTTVKQGLSWDNPQTAEAANIPASSLMISWPPMPMGASWDGMMHTIYVITWLRGYLQPHTMYKPCLRDVGVTGRVENSGIWHVGISEISHGRFAWTVAIAAKVRVWLSDKG